MKRSKIFLGVTTCLLAMAGVAAAKHFGPNITRWYVTGGVPGHCVATGIITCQYHSHPIFTSTCLYSVGFPPQHFAVFTSGATGARVNCLHKFVYTRAD